ncbi:zinc-ribbon domain-containing protein [Halobacillus sp. A5]|uniref:TcaA NTF2-like domain-containing protein n=1 Tax=Halobacillus sp. A5 TaxID=2880263 RepID=UPI0020A628A4|nr:zinc-ribbon domain-containing protein [Halobacillus sp. A5]MCP3027932.1 zinc-ribbon domain-containing protein [Halobacillus sp. A5]
MNFCTECGHTLSQDQRFCIHCGIEQQSLSRKTRARSKPLQKRTKITIGVAAAAALLLFGGHLFLSNKYDPMAVVKELDDTFTEKDAEAFFDSIELEEEALLNKKEFLDYIDQSGWEDIRKQMVEAVNEKELKRSIKDFDGHELFILKKEPRLAGLYPIYRISAEPEPVKAETNLAPMVLEVGERSIELENKSLTEAALAYPGSYNVKGTAENEFGRFHYNEELYVYPSEDLPSEILITFPEETYSIRTNESDATLFINGKSTGKTLSEFEELGPFPDDKEVWMYAERTNKDGETERTEEISQYYNYWGSLAFEFYEYEDYEQDNFMEEEEVSTENDDMTKEAGIYVEEFREAYEDALNAADYSYISSYLEEDSDAAFELEDYISEIDGQDYVFTFITNEVQSTEQIDEETYIVTTNELFEFINNKGEETYYDRMKDYTLTSSSEGLKITSITINETIRN